MKKVLIIMSERTGNGHKSSAMAIQKKLEPAGYDVKLVDAFPLMGKRRRNDGRLLHSYDFTCTKFMGISI